MGYLAFVQTVKSTASQNLTTLGGLDWRHWANTSLNSSTRKTSGTGISELSAIGTITSDNTLASGRTVTASDPTLSSDDSGVYYGSNGTTGWGVRLTIDIGTTRKKCWLLLGQFSSAGKLDISLSDSSASAISYTYAQSSIYSTDGLLVEFDLEANSAGQTATIDFTCSTNIDFGRIAVQAVALSNASSGPTVFDMTAASQEWTPNAVQNKRTVTTTTAALEWTPNAIQNKRTAVMTAASQEWTPNAIQNRLTATMTSPALEWTANAIQNLRRVTLTAPVFSWSAKTIQNLYRATLSAAQIRLTAQAFSARLLVTLTSVTNGSWSAKALQMLQRVSLTRATLNFQPLAFDFISDAIVEVVRKIRSRLSHYRKLLKQRRY